MLRILNTQNIKNHFKAEYSETLGLGLSLDQFYGLGLGLEAESYFVCIGQNRTLEYIPFRNC